PVRIPDFSEGSAEGQVVSRMSFVVESKGQVDRAQDRIQAEENAAIGARAVPRDFAPVGPYVALLDRRAEVYRNIQEPGALVADLAVVDATQNGVVRPRQRVGGNA